MEEKVNMENIKGKYYRRKKKIKKKGIVKEGKEIEYKEENDRGRLKGWKWEFNEKMRI